MPKCPSCNAEMVLHNDDDGFSKRVWRCRAYSYHPTVTTKGGGAKAVQYGAAAVGFFVGGPVGAVILGAIFSDISIDDPSPWDGGSFHG